MVRLNQLKGKRIKKSLRKSEKGKGGTDMSVSKKVLSVGLAAVLAASMIPAVGVFAADEDFGMIPIEAQSCGTPVIAYGRGGSLETVKEGVTGLFFYEQTVESIIGAVERFEKLETSFDPKIIRNHAETFSEERFKKEIKEFVELKYNEFNHLVK